MTLSFIHANGEPLTLNEIPSIDFLQSNWIERDPVKGNPTTQNLRGSLSSGINLMAFENIRSPPYSSAPLPFNLLFINQNEILFDNHMWSPYNFNKKAIDPISQAFQLESDTRMGYNFNSILISLSITSLVNSPLNLSIGLRNLSPLIRDYSNYSNCEEWHQPKPNENCWNWFGPSPSTENLSKEFSYSNFSSNGFLTKDLITPTFSAVSLSPNPDSFSFYPYEVDHYEHNFPGADWKINLAPLQNFTIQYVFTFGESDDVIFTANSLLNSFSTSSKTVKSSWDYLFKSVFTPGCSGLFSGWLPVLTSDDEDLTRVYYSSVASLLVNLRTNLQHSTQQRLYIAGAAGNGTTNSFLWDLGSFVPTVLTLLDPTQIKGQTEKILNVDISQYSGIDFISDHGIGDFHAGNHMAMFTLLYTYISIQNDTSIFMNNIASKSYFEWLNETATHWINLTSTLKEQGLLNKEVDNDRKAKLDNLNLTPLDFLADYGKDSLLESISTYTNKIASFNSGNAWMMFKMGQMLELLGNHSEAALYYTFANQIVEAVMNKLYIPFSNDMDGGFFQALYPDGSSNPVRHVIDFAYVSKSFGSINLMNPDQLNEMIYFYQTQLLDSQSNWIRALSLKDQLNNVNPDLEDFYGSFDGWPALIINSLGVNGKIDEMINLFRKASSISLLGPYGQAHHFTKSAYKPSAPILYNDIVGGSFADSVITSLFGFSPDIVTSQDFPNLLFPNRPRGFNGTLHGVRFGDSHFTITSNNEGLTVQTDSVSNKQALFNKQNRACSLSPEPDHSHY